MERQKIERNEEVKGSEKSWGQSSSEVRGEERLKEAMTQHLRLRFLPWREGQLDYSPSDWPEPGMIPTRDCYICLGVGGRKEVEADSECYGEDGGGRARDPFPKSQHKVLTQITSPTSRSVTWSIRRTRTPVKTAVPIWWFLLSILKANRRSWKLRMCKPLIGGILFYSQ